MYYVTEVHIEHLILARCVLNITYVSTDSLLCSFKFLEDVVIPLVVLIN